MKVVDVHTHMLNQGFLKLLRKHGQKQYPSRVRFMCSLPWQHPKLAIAEPTSAPFRSWSIRPRRRVLRSSTSYATT